jgi:hypothetical protein
MTQDANGIVEEATEEELMDAAAQADRTGGAGALLPKRNAPGLIR